MNVMKLALLGTVAFAAASVSARADELADLKAQIEALQADVAALQAAPSVPAGYSLLTMSQSPRIVVPGLDVRDSHGQSATAMTFGVMPTADVPASTIIQWSGSVRAALVYRDYEQNEDGVTVEDDNELHIWARGRLDVTGTTDTAVGEVGASMSIFADWDDAIDDYFTNSATVKMDYAWGWWKMTPELTFAGGYNGSLATIGYGIRKVNDAYISRGDTGVDGDDFVQFRLSYNSGPLGIAVALEHTDEDDNNGGDGSPLGVAGEVTYTGDMLSVELAGFLRDAGDFTQSQIGLGVGAKLTEMFDVSLAGSIGNNVFYTQSDNEQPGAIGDGWEVSGAIIAGLTDSFSAELGAGFSSYGDNENDPGDGDTDTMAVAGGIYWSPVSQLKMGGQASWVTREEDNWNDDSEELKAAFVTWWNF